MTRTRLTAVAIAALLAAVGRAEPPAQDDAPAPAPDPIRIWGSPADRHLLSALEAAYRERHPEARFSYHLYGPESTLAGVYTGVADLAFMARELREPLERMAFEWALLSKPYEIGFAHAGFDPAAPGAQLGVFVNSGNPLEFMSLAQLDAVLGTERRRGGRAVDGWSTIAGSDARLGAIHVHGPQLDSIAALFVRRTVMLDSHKWNPGYRESRSRNEALEAVATDPAGLAIAAIGAVPRGVKQLALSLDIGGPAVPPTRNSVQDGSYPLARTLTIVVNRPPGQKLEPRLARYLRFLLSPAGQSTIERDGRDFPLSESAARKQIARLD